jgi:hypothetical protein
MIGTLSTKFAAVVRAAGVTAALGAAAASLVGFAGAAHASSGTSVPDANHELGMYGDPAAAAPYWRQQHTSDCAEMAVADVVGQVTQNQPTEQQVLEVAKNTPSKVHPGPIWGPGTAMGDIPVLLDHYGIKYEAGFTNAPAMDRLERALAQGRKVIVTLNAETIWSAVRGADVGGQHLYPDHALVVTGVDTKANVVHLNDSGYPNGRDEQVPIAAFEQAWATSNHWIAATLVTVS